MVSGLGPPRSAQPDLDPSYASVRRTRVRQTGSPRPFIAVAHPRVAWRFPDWTAVGFRFRRVFPHIVARGVNVRRRVTADLPSPCLGSAPASRPKRATYSVAGASTRDPFRNLAPVTGRLSRAWARRAALRRLSRRARTTSRAATVTRIAMAVARQSFSGGHGAWETTNSTGVDLALGRHLSLAAGSCRARIRLLRTAIHLEIRTRYRKPSPISPVIFVPDDEGKYTQITQNSRSFRTSRRRVIHRRSQVSAAAEDERCTSRWTN
jgi:hypothetical protein